MRFTFRLEPTPAVGWIETIISEIGHETWTFSINPIPLVVSVLSVFIVVLVSVFKPLYDIRWFFQSVTAVGFGLWTFTSSLFFSFLRDFEQNVLDLANEVSRNPETISSIGLHLLTELGRRAESLCSIKAISSVAPLAFLTLFFSLVLAKHFPKNCIRLSYCNLHRFSGLICYF